MSRPAPNAERRASGGATRRCSAPAGARPWHGRRARPNAGSRHRPAADARAARHCSWCPGSRAKAGGPSSYTSRRWDAGASRHEDAVRLAGEVAREGGRILGEVEPDAARHAPEGLQRMGVGRRRGRESGPRCAWVQARERRAGGQRGAASSPAGTLAQRMCQSVGRSPPGSASVVRGPPPRSEVRLPRPPAGA